MSKIKRGKTAKIKGKSGEFFIVATNIDKTLVEVVDKKGDSHTVRAKDLQIISKTKPSDFFEILEISSQKY